MSQYPNICFCFISLANLLYPNFYQLIMYKKKNILLSLVLLLFVTVLLTYLCDKIIVDNANNSLYSETKEIPFNRVGLLLGTTKYTKTAGFTNPYYTFRIEAASKLIRENKIKYLIISGDNGHKEYNEPELMRKDLMKAGIDSSKIFLDYAGFRTLDSIKRVKEVFGQDSVTIISQKFHNERAIYIASKEKIYAIGFNAKDVTKTQGFKTQLREKFARVKVFLDYIFGVKSKFLGKKITIPA